MPKHHKHPTAQYTNICYGIFLDNELSYKSKGLLCQMWSLPDEWDFSVEGLSKLSSDGKDSVRSAIHELEESGYLQRESVRGSDGRLGSIEYHLYDKRGASLMSDGSSASRPSAENPSAVNSTQSNINTSIIKESTIKESIPQRERKKAVSVQEVISMLPEELQETAEMFVEHRKKLKSPMTGHALELAIKKAKKYANDNLDTTIAIMEQSIENGWKGIFELKEESPKRTGGRNDWIDEVEYTGNVF